MSAARQQSKAGKVARPRVGVAGVGQIPFRTRYPDRSFQELAFEVASAALRDAGITKDDVQSAVYGIYSDMLMRQQSSDSLVHDYLGLRGKPALRISAGASTGAFAARAAYAYPQQIRSRRSRSLAPHPMPPSCVTVGTCLHIEGSSGVRRGACRECV